MNAVEPNLALCLQIPLFKLPRIILCLMFRALPLNLTDPAGLDMLVLPMNPVGIVGTFLRPPPRIIGTTLPLTPLKLPLLRLPPPYVGDRKSVV